MNIFIAGGTGAIGRFLVPLVVNADTGVVVLTGSADRTSQLERMGAVPVVGDVYDEVRLTRLVAESEAEVIIQQLTAFGNKGGDPYAETMRVRTEGTRNLISAARAARVLDSLRKAFPSYVRRSVADSATKRRPASRCLLDSSSVRGSRRVARTSNTGRKRNVRDRAPVRMVLRPGTSWDPQGIIPRAIREGTYPIVGNGAGTYSSLICVTPPPRQSRF